MMTPLETDVIPTHLILTGRMRARTGASVSPFFSNFRLKSALLSAIIRLSDLNFNVSAAFQTSPGGHQIETGQNF